MTNPGVSVVICTYNGAERLPETIRHIARQNVPRHIPWEFIVVNNASSDNTAEVTHRIWSSYDATAPLIIVDEPNPGLSFARSKGFATANFEFVLMCDDDNWLDPDYVKLVFEIMSTNETIGALGGRGELVFETEPPEWVRHFPIFAAGAQASKSGPTPRARIYGAGCVIRKSAYERLMKAGFRSLLTDRLGKELSSGGDYELCYGLFMARYTIWYDERLTFRHFIPSDRFSRDYYIKYLRESSRCFDVLEPYKLICERKFINLESFRILMYRLFLHYLQRYAIMQVQRLFAKPGSTRKTILSLRLFSIGTKLSLLVARRKELFKNYSYGKTFQQKFGSKSPNSRKEPSQIQSSAF